MPLPDLPPKKPIHVVPFQEYISLADESVRCAPIVAVGAYRITSNENKLVKLTSGVHSHQFLGVEVMLEKGPVYIAVHFYPGPFEVYHVSHVVVPYNDLETMCEGSIPFATMSSDIWCTFTLEDLANLLTLVLDMWGGYDLLTRNCYWSTALLLFGIARRFSKEWPAMEPQCLREYADGERDENSALTQIIVPQPGKGKDVLRGMLQFSLHLLRDTQSFFSRLGPPKWRVRSLSEEIAMVLADWQT